MEPVEWVVGAAVIGLLIFAIYIINEGIQRLRERNENDESGV